MDKVFLLSDSEAYTESAIKYGFSLSGEYYDKARMMKSSIYAKAMGTWSNLSTAYVGSCWWRLRGLSYVCDNGSVDRFDSFSRYDYINIAVCPALHLDLSSSNLYAYAGTVSSNRIENSDNNSDNDKHLKNPREDDKGVVTWDCVWFGNYPQAEVITSGMYTALDSNLLQMGDVVVSDSVYNKLNNATGWNANEDIIVDGNKYRRIKKNE